MPGTAPVVGGRSRRGAAAGVLCSLWTGGLPADRGAGETARTGNCPNEHFGSRGAGSGSRVRLSTAGDVQPLIYVSEFSGTTWTPASPGSRHTGRLRRPVSVQVRCCTEHQDEQGHVRSPGSAWCRSVVGSGRRDRCPCTRLVGRRARGNWAPEGPRSSMARGTAAPWMRWPCRFGRFYRPYAASAVSSTAS